MNFGKIWVRLSIKLKRLKSRVRKKLKKHVIHFCAAVSNIFSAPRINIRKQISGLNDGEIVLNLLGNVRMGSPEPLLEYDDALSGIDAVLSEADVNLVYSRHKNPEEHHRQLEDLFAKHAMSNIANHEQPSSLALFESPVGNIGVIGFYRFAKLPRGRRVKVELLRAVLALKKQNADYIILYMYYGSRKMRNAEEKALHSFLFDSGIDYIVGVKPGLIKEGETYLRADRAVSRAMLSVGSLLSDITTSRKRVILRLKLKKANNKLQAYHESYIPYIYDEGHFVDLSAINADSCDADELAALRKSLGSIEAKLSRIKAINRVLTVGKIAELSGVSLPEEYQYLNDFTVGHFSTRSSGRVPGDVFMFAQPYPDPNDAAAYNHEKRLGIALNTAEKCLFVFSHKSIPTKTPYVIVEDILEAHTRVTAHVRKDIPARIIAVTGSIGKTSTKTMLYEVIKTCYRTETNSKNENTQLYMSVNVQNIRSNTEIYIQETGGGRVRGASRHSRMILPEATVITNIGDAHIGNFGTREALMYNKLQIIDGMPEHGVLYLNGDDPLLITAKPDCKTVFYAVYNKEADYYADDITETEEGMDFCIVHGDHRVHAHLNVPGMHNVLNAVCCYAIGQQYNIPDDLIVKGIAAFRTAGVRQNIVRCCGRSFFLDCFNASSGSFDSSLETLYNLPLDKSHKKIALLGDITGQGETAEQTHEEVAEIILKYPIDKYILFGSDIKLSWEILKERGVDAFYSENRNEINEFLKKNVAKGDMLLVKGSSKMELQKCLDMVYGTCFTDEVLINEGKHWVIHSGGVKYNMFSNYSTAVSASSSISHLKFKRRVGDTKLINIQGPFASHKLEEVTLHNGIVHIGHGAFKNAARLKKLNGAQSLKFIGVRAFFNCESLEQIELPEGLLHIGNGAFAGCSSLRSLYIPESVEEIGKKAFFDCPELVLSCRKGSYAEQYCIENELNYSCK